MPPLLCETKYILNRQKDNYNSLVSTPLNVREKIVISIHTFMVSHNRDRNNTCKQYKHLLTRKIVKKKSNINFRHLEDLLTKKNFEKYNLQFKKIAKG